MKSETVIKYREEVHAAIKGLLKSQYRMDDLQARCAATDIVHRILYRWTLTKSHGLRLYDKWYRTKRNSELIELPTEMFN